LRHNSVQIFISHVARWLRTRRFSEPTFRPSGPQIIGKNRVFRDFSTFSRACIFFLSGSLFSDLLSADSFSWRAINFWFCFRGRFWIFFWVPGSMLSCFSDFLLFCFSAFLLLCFSCFSASLLYLLLCFSASLLLLSLLLCFSCFSAFLLFCFLLFLLLCFSASLFSLLLCFCTSVPFYLYYSTFSFLQSCVFAALLPAPLLPCFLSLLSLCFQFLVLYSVLFVSR